MSDFTVVVNPPAVVSLVVEQALPVFVTTVGEGAQGVPGPIGPVGPVGPVGDIVADPLAYYILAKS